MNRAMERRIDELENRVVRLQTMADRLVSGGMARRQPRLGLTVSNYLATPQYPTPPQTDPTTGQTLPTSPPPANVFPFVFVDGTYVPQAGRRSLATVDRTTSPASGFKTPASVVFNLNNSYIAEGTPIEVWEDGDQFYTVHGGSSTPTQNNNNVMIARLAESSPATTIEEYSERPIVWNTIEPSQDLSAGFGLTWSATDKQFKVTAEKDLYGICVTNLVMDDATGYGANKNWQLTTFIKSTRPGVPTRTISGQGTIMRTLGINEPIDVQFVDLFYFREPIDSTIQFLKTSSFDSAISSASVKILVEVLIFAGSTTATSPTS